MNEGLKVQIERLGISKKKIETDLQMPLNSLSAMMSGKRNTPTKWENALMEYCLKNGLQSEIDENNKPENKKRIEKERSGINEDEKMYEIAGMGGRNKIVHEAIKQLVEFNTATTKTELIDGEVKQSVVDKKKIVNEEKEWQPKLSPYMLSRQNKAKGGGK